MVIIQWKGPGTSQLSRKQRKCFAAQVVWLTKTLLSRGLPEQLQAQTEAAVEEEETGPPLGTKRQYLVVMRHGERMDEIDVGWRQTSKRPWDPPLSDKGLLQVGPRCIYTRR